jgi:hypothetical protein
LAVVDPQLVPADIERCHQPTYERQHLGVSYRRGRPDDVDVGLNEFALSSGLRILTAPDGRDVIALERQPDRLGVLRGEPGERDCQVEPQGNLAVAVVAELVDLTLNLGVGIELAEQHFAVLQGRRVDRCETKVAEHALRTLDAPLLDDRALGQLVQEALQRAGDDARRHVLDGTSEQNGVRRDSHRIRIVIEPTTWSAKGF